MKCEEEDLNSIGRNRFSKFYFLGIVVLVCLIIYSFSQSFVNNDYAYSDFLTDLKANNIKQLTIKQNKEVPTGKLVIKLSNSNESKIVYVTDVNKVISDIDKAKADNNKIKLKPYIPDVSRDSVFLTSVVPMILLGIVVVVVLIMMNANAGGGGGKMANFGKSRAKMVVEIKNMDFTKVAGLEEEKEELEEIVDFLKDPKKYISLGARIPKGVLLEGPPGTGKTLLAKATAGEAGVPFFTISGSDFVEMFVGVGASRVRDLFEQAKKNAPCIVFIDEIDAVGRQRGAGLGGGHDEREQTLNQLLVEMDGFAANEGIIIIAATNRPDILDPALLRPGRFDRQIVVDRPDVRGREAILKVHTKGKPVDSDVNLDVLARRTPGFTGADLSNLVNEAALLSARRNKKTISMNSLEESIERVIAGPERKSKVISDREKRLTAYHEGGHALIGLLLPNADPVHKVTIIPRGRAGGYTLMLPKEDRSYATRGELLDRLKTMLGGRVAEEVVLKEISTGASNDIQQASGLVRSMITQYGMSDVLGPIAFGDGQDHQVFLGRDFNNQRNYSEDVACAIDKEVRRYIEEAYDECRKLLIENIDKLHLIAKALIEKETLEEKDLKIIMETGSLEGVCEIKEANSEEKETSTTEEVKNAEVVEEKQADAVAKESVISTTEKI